MTTNEPNQTITTETVTSEAGASEPTRATDPRVERTAETAGHIVEAAVEIGRSWAAYGLRVGKLALETHAHTMGKLASALGEVNAAIDARRDARSDEPTPSTPS